MCHFLVSRGYSFVDPFNDFSLGQLVTHYKYQQKLVKREMLQGLTTQVAFQNLKSGTDEGKTVYQGFVAGLTRPDQI